jgi:hypothetical protein
MQAEVRMHRYQSRRFYYEGTREQLLRAGLISEDQALPTRPRGFTHAYGRLKVTMGANGLLRVHPHTIWGFESLDRDGCIAQRAAALLDSDFQRFMQSCLP